MKFITTYFISMLFVMALVLVGAPSLAQDNPSKIANSKSDTLINISSDFQQVLYGKMPKRSVSSSISSISGKDIEKNTVFSLGNTLYGKIPGLILDQAGGEPGYDTPGFNVRGIGTFGYSKAPIILVDGFERDLNSVSVYDVESISVLKDASATALYGIRAANGIIMVTTKRGIVGQKNLTVDVTQGFQSPIRLPKFVNSAQYVKMYNQACANDGLPAQYSADQIAGYENGNRLYYPDVDWMKEAIREFSPSTSVNVSSRGGNKGAQYYVSLGYISNTGIYKNTEINDGYSTNSNLDRINFRSNIDVNLVRDLTLKLNLGGQINDVNSPRMATSDIWSRLYDYPTYLFPVYVKDNLYGGTSTFPDNPMGYINSRGYRTTHNRFFQSDLDLKYDLGRYLKGLTIGARLGFDNQYNVSDAWSKTFAVFQVTKDSVTGNPDYSAPIGANTNLAYTSPYGDSQSRRTTLEVYSEYNHQISEKQALNLLVMYNQSRLVLGKENPYNNQDINGRLQYSYDNRFFADLSASYSGSEAFAKGKRFGLFPAISAAWILSEEGFLKNNSVLNYLKMRASAGVVGTSKVETRFGFRQLYVGSGTYYFGSSNAGVSGITESTISNPDLTFEKSYQYEVGFDGRLLNELDFTVSVFLQNRKDILTSQSTTVPALFGGTLPSINKGKVRNQGIEASLLWNKQFKNAGFFTKLNMSYIKDKVVSMEEEVVPPGSEYYYRTGHPVYYSYGLQAIGFFESADDIAKSPVQQFGPVQPGDIKYKDRNNDGVINDYDNGPICNGSVPTLEFGFELGFNYKGFDVQAMLQAQVDRYINLASYPDLFFPLRSTQKISTFVTEPWTAENKDHAQYPRLSTMDNANNYRNSSFWYRNGDFLKLRSLELGYNLPEKMFGKIKPSMARIFLRGMNLLILDHFKYSDPENVSGYPAMKSYNIGLKVQF
ncbi:MAG: SusC/RagA family TonB-linked outer membrane protein [Bacteroidota bacterium]|nr:SusC/RagA family TonB-linked outer membrane protein [Bacteroidota bacterium]